MSKDRAIEIERQDKELLATFREYCRLHQVVRRAPLVPLEKPYRRGWVKALVLRDDVARRRDAPTLKTILGKLGSEVYCRNKNFTTVQNKKKVVVQPCLRIVVEEGQLARTKPGFTCPEYVYGWPFEGFTPRKYFDYGNQYVRHGSFSRVYKGWAFRTPWMFVPQIRPNYVTHVRMAQPEVESRLAEITNHLYRDNLWPRLNRLLSGQHQYREFDTEREHRRYVEAKFGPIPDGAEFVDEEPEA